MTWGRINPQRGTVVNEPDSASTPADSDILSSFIRELERSDSVLRTDTPNALASWDTRGWNKRPILAALSQLAEARGENAKLRAVCADIVMIDDERALQEKAGFIDTPVGLEHMGDVWNQLSKWAYLVRVPSPPPAEGEGR